MKELFNPVCERNENPGEQMIPIQHYCKSETMRINAPLLVSGVLVHAAHRSRRTQKLELLGVGGHQQQLTKDLSRTFRSMRRPYFNQLV